MILLFCGCVLFSVRQAQAVKIPQVEETIGNGRKRAVANVHNLQSLQRSRIARDDVEPCTQRVLLETELGTAEEKFEPGRCWMQGKVIALQFQFSESWSGSHGEGKCGQLVMGEVQGVQPCQRGKPWRNFGQVPSH